MRLFIAVAVDPVKRRVAEIIADLKASNADCAWVKQENLHLTLHFLGETPECRLDAVKTAMADACRGQAPFQLSFAGLGAFPSMSRPRVLWLGLDEGAQPLADLAARLAKALECRGLPPAGEDRAFKAHLTLGRIRGPRDLRRLSDRAAAWTPERMGLGPVRVDGIQLVQSRLSPRGAAYAVVGRAEMVQSGPP